MPTDRTYDTESLHTVESRERDARFVGFEPKGSKMTDQVDRETVEDIISTLNSIQFFDQVHDVDLSAAAKTLRALLAERDRLRDENEGALAIIATERAEVLKLRAERDRLREAITWASVITSHGMGLSTSEERTLHSVLTSALQETRHDQA